MKARSFARSFATHPHPRRSSWRSYPALKFYRPIPRMSTHSIGRWMVSPPLICAQHSTMQALERGPWLGTEVRTSSPRARHLQRRRAVCRRCSRSCTVQLHCENGRRSSVWSLRSTTRPNGRLSRCCLKQACRPPSYASARTMRTSPNSPSRSAPCRQRAQPKAIGCQAPTTLRPSRPRRLSTTCWVPETSVHGHCLHLLILPF
mmetsp:Transcript_69020/g.114717  ORF Transcript_69020/g.114717 Transcript_69020/m.114717 type:complete len:204 (+) Transcript_69020:708-1319(+)